MNGIESVGWSMLACGLVMALFPAGFVFVYLRSELWRGRLAEAPAELSKLAPGLVRRVWVLTAVGLVLMAPLLLLDEPPQGAWIGLSIGVFHLVWWTAASRLLQIGPPPQPVRFPGDLPGAKAAKSATSAAPATSAGASVRTASLVARPEQEYLPGWVWVIPIGLLVGAVTLIAWRVAGDPTVATGTLVLVACSVVSALSFFVGYGWWARHSANSPQDVSGAADPRALAEAYDAYRRFLVRSIFGMMVLAMIVLLGAGVAVVLHHGNPALQGPSGGLWGGIGGSVVGLLGGVFGTICTVRRMRLERLRRGDPPAAVSPSRQGA